MKYLSLYSVVPSSYASLVMQCSFRTITRVVLCAMFSLCLYHIMIWNLDLCLDKGLMFISMSALILVLISIRPRGVKVLFNFVSVVLTELDIIGGGVPHGLLGVGGRW